jgi:endonuclease YncB( thermonuclease family)
MAGQEEQDFLESIINYTPMKIGVMEAVDGDTVIHPDIDKPIRLTGYDTPEIAKWIEGEYKAGTAGGESTAKTLTRLANEMGYTELRLQRDSRGKPLIDNTKKRYLGDLYNENGESWERKILSEGLVEPTKYTSQSNRLWFELEKDRRDSEYTAGVYDEDVWTRARDEIITALDKEGYRKAGFKLMAQDERELKYMQDMGFGNYFNDAQVVSRHKDRTLTNKALNPMGDTWYKTWTGVKEAGWGTATMFGDLTHWDAVSHIGEMGVERARRQIEPYAESIQSYKDVDSFSTGFEYLTNMFAMSVPYMAITSAAYFTAPATFGASLLVPASMYAGQTYNEMDSDNKNVGIAAASGVIQTALDLLGIRYIMKSPVYSRDLFQKAYKELVTNKGMTGAQARQAIGSATRVSLAKFAGDAAGVASKQLAAKQVFLDLIKRQAKAGTVESVTEGMQEATAYIAAHHMDIGEGVFNMEELVSRTTEGMVAGGMLGGSIATVGSLQNYAGWTDVKYRLAPAHEKDLSTASMLAELEANSKEGMKSNEENASDAIERFDKEDATRKRRKRKPKKGSRESEPDHIMVRSQEDIDRRKKQGIIDEGKERLINPLGLVQGSMPNAISNSDAVKFRSFRRIRDLVGGMLQRVYSGENFMTSKQHRVAIYKNMVAPDKMFFKEMGETGRINNKARRRASERLLNFVAKYSRNNKFNEKLVPDDGTIENRANLIKHAKLIQELSNKLYKDQRGVGATLGFINNYLFRFKALNKRIVNKYKAEFQKLLQTEYKYTPDKAKKTTDEIIDNNEVYDLDSADFSVTNQGIIPSAHRKRSLNLSENPKFAKFMEQDIYNNISQASKQAARFIAHRKYIGENSKVLNQLLHEAEHKDGAPRAKVNKVARIVNDILNADSGNFKRPSSEMGKRLMRLQRNFLTLTTFASLPLAAISSTVELGLVTKGLTADEIFSIKKDKNGNHSGLKGIGRELGKAIWDGTKEIADLGTQRSSEDIFSWGQQRLRELGLYDWSVGAATVTGVTETNAAQQMYFEAFFKWNGLTGITNLPRAMRASLFGDFLYNRVEEIYEHRQSGDVKTRSVQEAESQLRDLGIRIDGEDNIVDLMFDPDLIATGKDLTAINPTGDRRLQEAEKWRKIVNQHGDPHLSKFEAYNKSAGIVGEGKDTRWDALVYKEEMLGMQIQEATFNFIRDAVALPDAANRPLFYQDPRFALFFQFQGFIATFTANHIPKLWGEYIKRGTPALKYNAFATMATMIMLSFASQYLKDLLKYGERTPYLDDAEYFQRGIRSSGLLGTTERVIDQFMPLYNYRSGSGPTAWVFDTTTSESPALGYGKRALGAMRKFAEGDVGEAVRLGTKLAPVVAPFNQIGNQWGKFADRWNFKGER